MRAFIRASVERLQPYVPGEQRRGAKIVKLNTNENPYPPSPAVGAALRRIPPADLRMYPDPAATRLREKIAGIHGCAPGNVFAGNGSDEILALCTRAFVENDGSIGFFEPSYSLYPVLAAMRDVPARPVDLAGDFGWPAGFPPARGRREKYRCSLFLLANPNAPTGIMYDREVVRAFCKRSSGVVVIDEAYVDFARSNCVDLALKLDNVLIVRTFSKAYSLAGVRMGYAIGHARLISALFKLKDSYNTDEIAQRIALAAVSDRKHMLRNVGRIRSTRDRLCRLLRQRGFTVFASETNFLWARPPVISAREFFERLREKRILIRYFPGRRTGEFVRISIGTDAEANALVRVMDDLWGEVFGDSRPGARACCRKTLRGKLG